MDKTKIYEALGIDYKIVTTDFASKLSGEKRLPNVVYLRQFTPYNITPFLFKHLSKEYDVVNINLLGRFYSDAALRYFAGKKTKIILTPHSVYHAARYKLIKRFFQRCVFPVLLKNIDALVTLTEYEKSIWNFQFKVPAEKIVVIPHYITIKQPARTEPSFRLPGKYLLYLGRNDINKRPDLLIQAFLQLHHPEYFLLLTLNESDVTRAIAVEAKKNDHIKFLGSVNEDYKHQLLQNAEAVVVPTIWEAFGYTAFEASYYAKPVLCSNIPVFNELLDARGVLFFDNTVESLKHALSMFFHLTEKEKIERGNFNRINIQRFAFSTSVQKYNELFAMLGFIL